MGTAEKTRMAARLMLERPGITDFEVMAEAVETEVKMCWTNIRDARRVVADYLAAKPCGGCCCASGCPKCWVKPPSCSSSSTQQPQPEPEPQQQKKSRAKVGNWPEWRWQRMLNRTLSECEHWEQGYAAGRAAAAASTN